MRKPLHRLSWFGLAILATVTDLLIKAAAETQLSVGRSLDFGLVRLELIYNRGVSFSFGADLPVAAILIVTGIIIVAIATYLWRATAKPRPIIPAGLTLVLGGAVANFLDRLDGRGVVDYLNVPGFAIFNLADIFVVGGALLTAIGYIIVSREPTLDDEVRD